MIMSSSRANAQVAAALRRTGSVPKETNTNAPKGRSAANSPSTTHPAKGKGTPESGKPTKVPKTKTPPKKGRGTRNEEEANSEDEILFVAEEPPRRRQPTRQRAPREADNVGKNSTKNAENQYKQTSDDELPSGDEEQPNPLKNLPKSRSNQRSNKDDDQTQEEDEQDNDGPCNEDGDNEELANNTIMERRDKNPTRKPVLATRASVTHQHPLETHDDEPVRKRKARNKPYYNEKTVQNDPLKKSKHYDKPNQSRGGRRLPKKTKKTRYTKSDDEETSSNNSTDDDEQKFGNGKSLTESDATTAADYTLLECFMRQAIHNFSPSSQYKKPVMYWSTKVSTAAAHMLVERHAHEIPNLLQRYGGQTSLEMRFAKKLRFLANNERAIQTRQIKSTFLSKQNPETRLAENVLETELDLDELTPIRIHSNISHIKSIAQLQALLVSPKMYQDQILFDIFCLGLESGNFRQSRKRPYTPLNDVITKAHEAHFRVELYLAISKKSFRHHNVHSASAERVRLFNLTIIAVREGRQKYLKKSVETRMKSRTERQVSECERVGELEDNSDDYVDVEEDDL